MLCRSDIVCIMMLSGLLICQNAWASTKEYENLYHRLKKLYDTSEYSKCVNECSKIITTHEKRLMETRNYILLANFYELNADCLNRIGSIDEALNLLSTMLAKLQKELPKDHVARIKLKMGNIYKQAGLYSKALSSFQKVEQEYAEAFPQRFAEYARENYNDIASKEVAVISGEVSLENDSNHEGVIIKVFNGFEESETRTSRRGEYLIPLFSSTSHTKFSLFAYKKGYKPSIVNMVFDGSPEIVMKKVQLKRLPGEDTAVIAGVIFSPVSGGKLKQYHGIARFNKHNIEFRKLSENENIKKTMKSDVIFVTSDDNGIYTVALSAGLYLMKNGRKEKVFRLNKGEVRILNIIRAGILVD